MHTERFDRIAMRIGGGSSRRAMLGLLATLPVLGGLFALLEPDELDAKGRRKRRKKAHKHGKGRRRKHKKPQCRSHAKTKTCAGKCGLVKNNCKKMVDCGPCACGGGCPACHICDEQTDDCVADPNQQGDPCGDPGQVCQADGACACDADSCPAGRVCVDGICVPDPGTCSAGQNICQDPGTSDCNAQGTCDCVVTTSGASFCGLARLCSDCTSDEDCATVTGPGSVCTDTAGRFCGCQETNRRACVGPCGPCTRDAQCGDFQVCCGGQCRLGDCCTTADCGANETCLEECIGDICRGLCTCVGCHNAAGACRAGDAWAQCGSGNTRCAACARGEVCAAGSQTCGDCESGGSQRGTYCEIRNDFAKFQCAPNCACGAHVGGGPGVCWNVSGEAYCSSSQPICEFAADCVIEGLGDFCVPLGDCETGCNQTACVTACGTGADDGPPRLVVLD